MNQTQMLSKLAVQDVLEHLQDGVLITDQNKCVIAVSPSYCRTTGYSFSEIIGSDASSLRFDPKRKNLSRKIWTIVDGGLSWSGEVQSVNKDGSLCREWLNVNSIKDSHGVIRYYLIVVTDMTKRKRAEQTIRAMENYDPLTGLANRSHFIGSLNMALSSAVLNRTKLAVLFLDLDRVKIINNTLGHAVGDLLLKAVAERIRHCLGPIDSVYRLGGDEFTILVPAFDDEKRIAELTGRIFKALSTSFHLDGHDIYTTASIGVSYFPDHGVDAQVLCRNAETAMYRAKRLGRNNIQIFAPEMVDEMFEELSIGNHLRRALEKEEFMIHYQPQINVSSGEITGLEALLRWNHPKFGMVSPTRFIRWAEDSGFIVPLGQWVLKNACTQAKLWHDLGHRNVSVAVNLSARQFEEDNLVKTVFNVLEDTQLSPGSLDLELTESLLVEKSEYMKSVPFELQKAGVRFSIDDFGKGYSSLTYLKHFPAHTLKMDQSFVQDVTLNDDDAAIASAVVGLGHSLDLTVLAEGIETDGQLEFFRHLKCDKVQGFYLSKPLPADQVDAVLKDQKPFSADPLFSHRYPN